MNMRGNNANLIAQIGFATCPKITAGQSIDFDGMVNGYMRGAKFALEKEKMQQRERELEAFQQFQEQQALQKNREGLMRTLQYGSSY